MISLILFFQILILVRDEVRTVRPELIFSVRSLGANRLQLLRYVFVPASLPGLFTALRVSTGVSIAVLFFVESFGTRQGLGYYILVESWADWPMRKCTPASLPWPCSGWACTTPSTLSNAA